MAQGQACTVHYSLRVHVVAVDGLCPLRPLQAPPPGHVFQGRFGAKLVEDEIYLLAVTRYIDLNPVKIAACRRMNGHQRLARLESCPWSSYGGYVAAEKAEKFTSLRCLRNMAVTRPRRGGTIGLTSRPA